MPSHSASGGGGGGGGLPPITMGRVVFPITYLTSVSIHTAQVVGHFYLVSENEARLPPGKKPQKRLAIMADKTTFQSDLDVAVSRCVMFSQITEMSVVEDHLAPLVGPFTDYDILVQQTPVVDFIRTISGVFKPQLSPTVIPTYVLEDGHAVSNRAHCRLAPGALDDVVGSVAQEASMRSVRTAKDREILALQEALAKQKDEALLEMVDLHTQIETLKHSLNTTEQSLMATRRTGKEEKDLLVSRIRQLESERDLRAGRNAPGVRPLGGSTPGGGHNMSGDFGTPPPNSGGGGHGYGNYNASSYGGHGDDGGSPSRYAGRPFAVGSSSHNATGGYAAEPSTRGGGGGGQYSSATRPTNTSQPSPYTSASKPQPYNARSALESLQTELEEGERFLMDVSRGSRPAAGGQGGGSGQGGGGGTPYSSSRFGNY